MVGTVSRRRFLKLAASVVFLSSLPRPGYALASRGDVFLDVDFAARGALRMGKKVALTEVITGDLRLVDREPITGAPAGLLCESASESGVVSLGDTGLPTEWRLHAASIPFLATVEPTKNGCFKLTMGGSGNGHVIFRLHGLDGLSKGDLLRFGSLTRLLRGTPPVDFSWAIVANDGGGAVAPIATMPFSVNEQWFFDRHFHMAAEVQQDVELVLTFKASGQFEFSIELGGTQFVRNQLLRYFPMSKPDLNEVSDADDYTSCNNREFEISGLGPLHANCAFYAEVGEDPDADNIVILVREDYAVDLRVTRNREVVLSEVIGEVLPLHRWSMRCEIDVERSLLSVEWCGRRTTFDNIVIPRCEKVLLGAFGLLSAETYITSLLLRRVSPFAVFESRNRLTPLLYDDFHRRDNDDFGIAPTGQIWIKSKPPDSPEFAIVARSYAAPTAHDRLLATYLKVDFMAPPKSIACLASFDSTNPGGAVALISSTLGFPETGDGGSTATHIVFNESYADYGYALNGTLITSVAKAAYAEGSLPSNKTYGFGWVARDSEIVLLLPKGYFNRNVGTIWRNVIKQELTYELFKVHPTSSLPTIHAVAAAGR